MTLDIVNGEVVEPLDQKAARRIDKGIRLLVGSISDTLDRLDELLGDAKSGQIHLALGFPSWTAYVADVMANWNTDHSIEHRQHMVAVMSDAGMSTRVIGQALGVSHETARRDVTNNGQVSHNVTPDETPEPKPSEPKPSEPKPSEPKPPITGRDGKTYQRPTPPPADPPEPPKPLRRRPITDTFPEAVHKLIRDAEAIERLSQDDRFAKNLEQIAYQRGDLLRARDALTRVINAITT